MRVQVIQLLPRPPVPLTWLMVKPRACRSSFFLARQYHSRIGGPLAASAGARPSGCMKIPRPGPETSSMLNRGGRAGGGGVRVCQ